MFYECSAMLINPDTIRAALDTAPMWAKIALTMPQDRLRQDAEIEVSEHLYRALFSPVDVVEGQLPLPL